MPPFDAVRSLPAELPPSLLLAPGGELPLAPSPALEHVPPPSAAPTTQQQLDAFARDGRKVAQGLMNEYAREYGSAPLHWDGREQAEQGIARAMRLPAGADRAVVATIADKLIALGGDSLRVTPLPVMVGLPGHGLVLTALFKLEGADGRTHLVDTHGGDYADLQYFRDHNELPPVEVKMVMPENATYTRGPDGDVKLFEGAARIEGPVERVVRQAAVPVAVVGGLAGVAASATMLAAPAAIGGVALAAAQGIAALGGAVGVGTAALAVSNEAQRGQPLDPIRNPKLAWSYAGGLLSAASLGAMGYTASTGQALARPLAATLGLGGAGLTAADGVSLALDWEALDERQRNERLVIAALGVGNTALHGATWLRSPAARLPAAGEVWHTGEIVEPRRPLARLAADAARTPAGAVIDTTAEVVYDSRVDASPRMAVTHPAIETPSRRPAGSNATGRASPMFALRPDPGPAAMPEAAAMLSLLERSGRGRSDSGGFAADGLSSGGFVPRGRAAGPRPHEAALSPKGDGPEGPPPPIDGPPVAAAPALMRAELRETFLAHVAREMNVTPDVAQLLLQAKGFDVDHCKVSADRATAAARRGTADAAATLLSDLQRAEAGDAGEQELWAAMRRNLARHAVEPASGVVSREYDPSTTSVTANARRSLPELVKAHPALGEVRSLGEAAELLDAAIFTSEYANAAHLPPEYKEPMLADASRKAEPALRRFVAALTQRLGTSSDDATRRVLRIAGRDLDTDMQLRSAVASHLLRGAESRDLAVLSLAGARPLQAALRTVREAERPGGPRPLPPEHSALDDLEAYASAHRLPLDRGRLDRLPETLLRPAVAWVQAGTPARLARLLEAEAGLRRYRDDRINGSQGKVVLHEFAPGLSVAQEIFRSQALRWLDPTRGDAAEWGPSILRAERDVNGARALVSAVLRGPDGVADLLRELVGNDLVAEATDAGRALRAQAGRSPLLAATPGTRDRATMQARECVERIAAQWGAASSDAMQALLAQADFDVLTDRQAQRLAAASLTDAAHAQLMVSLFPRIMRALFPPGDTRPLAEAMRAARVDPAKLDALLQRFPQLVLGTRVGPPTSGALGRLYAQVATVDPLREFFRGGATPLSGDLAAIQWALPQLQQQADEVRAAGLVNRAAALDDGIWKAKQWLWLLGGGSVPEVEAAVSAAERPDPAITADLGGRLLPELASARIAVNASASA